MNGVWFSGLIRVVGFEDGERLGYGCGGEVISLERQIQLWNLYIVNRGQMQDIRWTIFASVSFVFVRHIDYMLSERLKIWNLIYCTSVS